MDKDFYFVPLESDVSIAKEGVLLSSESELPDEQVHKESSMESIDPFLTSTNTFASQMNQKNQQTQPPLDSFETQPDFGAINNNDTPPPPPNTDTFTSSSTATNISSDFGNFDAQFSSESDPFNQFPFDFDNDPFNNNPTHEVKKSTSNFINNVSFPPSVDPFGSFPPDFDNSDDPFQNKKKPNVAQNQLPLNETTSSSFDSFKPFSSDLNNDPFFNNINKDISCSTPKAENNKKMIKKDKEDNHEKQEEEEEENDKHNTNAAFAVQ